MEAIFLEHTYRWLKPGGVLVFVVPVQRLADCKHVLATHFRDIAVARLTEPECLHYKQVVLFGVRRSRRERERLSDSEISRTGSYLSCLGFRGNELPSLARRMLQALADGETNPTSLAALADKKLRATPAQLCDALSACTELNPVYRRLLKMVLEELQFLEQQIVQREQEMASLLSQHQEAVLRLAQVPGLGVASAQQIIAEVGAKAASFPSEKHLSSWAGACPGDEESAGVSTNHRSPKATAKCGAFSINAPTLQCGRKEASSRSCIAASYYAWDTIRPLGQLPIGFVG